MKKQRFAYLVEVDRDQVPGWNHQPEDVQKLIQKHLGYSIPHYNPEVYIVSDSIAKAAIEAILKNNDLGLFGTPEGEVYLVNVYGDIHTKIENPKAEPVEIPRMTDAEARKFQKDGEDILNEGPE